MKKLDYIKDDRGYILNLLEGVNIQGVSLIFSKKGSIRSNHYHKEDFHYLFVCQGKMKYYERDLDNKTTIIKVYTAGDMVLTEPMKVHKTVFLEDTFLLCLSKLPKDEARHDMVPEEF